MREFMDLERFPLYTLGTEAANTFVDSCRRQLSEQGLFNLEEFLRPATLERCVREVKPLLDSASFVHKRRHNIYFDDRPAELAENHPALKQFKTINHTICADQIPDSLIYRIYEWPPLATFLAAVLDKTERSDGRPACPRKRHRLSGGRSVHWSQGGCRAQ